MKYLKITEKINTTMRSQKYMDTCEYPISRSLYEKIRSGTFLDHGDVIETASIWSQVYGNERLESAFSDLYIAIQEFNKLNPYIKLGLAPKPHMEGMIDMIIGNRDFGKILRIPLSIYNFHNKYYLLIHTVQGYMAISDMNRAVLERDLGKSIGYSTLALNALKHLKESFPILFQHPSDNHWHSTEMDRRNRDMKGRKFSIYENTIRKILNKDKRINNIARLYEVLEHIEHFRIRNVDLIYLLPPPISIEYHPSYFTSVAKPISNDNVECRRMSFSELIFLPGSSLKEAIVSVRYLNLSELQQERS